MSLLQLTAQPSSEEEASLDNLCQRDEAVNDTGILPETATEKFIKLPLLMATV